MQTSNKTTMSCKIVGIKHKLQMWCLVVFCLLFPGFLVSLYHRVDGAELCAHRLVVSPPIQSFIHSCFSNIFVYLLTFLFAICLLSVSLLMPDGPCERWRRSQRISISLTPACPSSSSHSLIYHTQVLFIVIWQLALGPWLDFSLSTPLIIAVCCSDGYKPAYFHFLCTVLPLFGVCMTTLQLKARILLEIVVQLLSDQIIAILQHILSKALRNCSVFPIDVLEVCFVYWKTLRLFLDARLSCLCHCLSLTLLNRRYPLCWRKCNHLLDELLNVKELTSSKIRTGGSLPLQFVLWSPSTVFLL